MKPQALCGQDWPSATSASTPYTVATVNHLISQPVWGAGAQVGSVGVRRVPRTRAYQSKHSPSAGQQEAMCPRAEEDTQWRAGQS